MIVDRITEYLESKEKALNEEVLAEAALRFRECLTRQFMEERDSEFRLRPSNAGKCPRQLWYLSRGQKYEFNARTMMTFWFGDLLELGVLALAKLAGCDIGENQAEVDTHAGKGHIDGLLNHEGEYYLFEAKSMSDYGYKRFASEDGPFTDDTFGYVTQNRLYVAGLDVKAGVVGGVNKSTGHMHERLVERDDEYAMAMARMAKVSLASLTAPETPDWAMDQKYMPRAKCHEITDVRCSYCPAVEQCWPGVETVIVGGKPKFRIPDVPREEENLSDEVPF